MQYISDFKYREFSEELQTHYGFVAATFWNNVLQWDFYTLSNHTFEASFQYWRDDDIDYLCPAGGDSTGLIFTSKKCQLQGQVDYSLKIPLKNYKYPVSFSFRYSVVDAVSC